MKKILMFSMLALLLASCNKEVSSYYSKNYLLPSDAIYTLNPQNGSTVKKIVLVSNDFVASYRGEIEAEQEAMGRDIYDFQVTRVNFNRLHTGSIESLDNYLNSVNLFFDKKDGSNPIKIGTAPAINVDMEILQADLLELTTLYPNYEIYYTAVFDQVPTDIKSATIDGEFDISVSFKYKRK